MLVNAKKRSNSNHRGRLDIIADILDASFGGVRKTRIMYCCNLSFKQLKYYLEFLLNKRLLCAVSDNKGNSGLFEITDRGREFLKVYKGLKGLMN